MSDPKSVEKLKSALQCLPGVGPKSAQRMAFYLLERNRDGARQIGDAIRDALLRVNHCHRCQNFCESDLCHICDNPKRNKSQLCIVETPADLEAIEAASFFQGTYFVLMGHISPLDGIGPEQLGIDRLLQLIEKEAIAEVILATNLTIEGQATADFLLDVLPENRVKVSRLARGLPMGGELEYMDAGTLNQAFTGRRIMQEHS